MRNEGGRLSISISVSYFGYRKGKPMFGISDWSDVEFRYACEQQRFVISAIKLGGV